jgi:protein-L-isoaspartate(D-aspartate) O-methyltransferase
MSFSGGESTDDPFLPRRLRMVEEQLRARGIRDQRVLEVMGSVPRHEFVPHQSAHHSYKDHPVPIGEGQTISQPYIVALMIEALEIESEDTVLEIGTGTGYQAAVLSRIASRVITVERLRPLAEQAAENFARLGYHNIEVVVGDGSEGLPQFAPFKRMVAAAAAADVPEALLQQLDEGGTLVLPIGDAEAQDLMRIRKRSGKLTAENLGGCRFVPLIEGVGE